MSLFGARRESAGPGLRRDFFLSTERACVFAGVQAQLLGMALLATMHASLASGDASAGGLCMRAADASPLRVVSLNLCADELVLRLAAPGTVKSVTWLARDPALSNVAALAQTRAGQSRTRRRCCSLGSRSSDRRCVHDAHRSCATATAKAYRCSSLTCRAMSTKRCTDQDGRYGDWNAGQRRATDRRYHKRACRVERLHRHAAAETPPIAAIYQPNGLTIGRQSLVNDLLNRAGLRNLAIERRIDNYGAFPLEVAVAGSARSADSSIPAAIVRPRWRMKFEPSCADAALSRRSCRQRAFALVELPRPAPGRRCSASTAIGQALARVKRAKSE